MKDSEMKWIEPYPGYAYVPHTVTVEVSAQKRALELCGIEPAVFGDTVDPSTFVALGIHAGVRSGISANGSINMVQNVKQHRPALLGEPLSVSGRVLAVEEVPRGRIVTSEVIFSSQSGEPVITASRQSLRPDPAKSGVRGAGKRPDSTVREVADMHSIGRYTLTPENVANYSNKGVNPIHYDPEAAKRSGFRAPIIGGGMGTRYLTAEVRRHFAPRQLDMDFYFRRPIFWDDTVTVMVDEQQGTWRSICLVKDDQKVATEAVIKGIGGE